MKDAGFMSLILLIGSSFWLIGLSFLTYLNLIPAFSMAVAYLHNLIGIGWYHAELLTLFIGILTFELILLLGYLVSRRQKRLANVPVAAGRTWAEFMENYPQPALPLRAPISSMPAAIPRVVPPTPPSPPPPVVVDGKIIEHFSCGTSEQEAKFVQPNGDYVCPKCRKKLNLIGVDYYTYNMADGGGEGESV